MRGTYHTKKLLLGGIVVLLGLAITILVDLPVVSMVNTVLAQQGNCISEGSIDDSCDQDKDGVLDQYDRCVLVPGPADNDGCPYTATQPPATTPPPTTPPPTQPPATQPPATQPPATQPPATQPPATQPPATQPPATQPPATQPPATQPPATQPPATQPPATQQPLPNRSIDDQKTKAPNVITSQSAVVALEGLLQITKNVGMGKSADLFVPVPSNNGPSAAFGSGSDSGSILAGANKSGSPATPVPSLTGADKSGTPTGNLNDNKGAGIKLFGDKNFDYSVQKQIICQSDLATMQRDRDALRVRRNQEKDRVNYFWSKYQSYNSQILVWLDRLTELREKLGTTRSQIARNTIKTEIERLNTSVALHKALRDGALASYYTISDDVNYLDMKISLLNVQISGMSCAR